MYEDDDMMYTPSSSTAMYTTYWYLLPPLLYILYRFLLKPAAAGKLWDARGGVEEGGDAGKVTVAMSVSNMPFNCPDERMAAGCAFDAQKGCMYVYGGLGTAEYLKTLHRYDSSSYEWQDVKRGRDDPGGRVHVKMVVSGKKLVMFGGSTAESDFSDDLFVMDVSGDGAATKGWVKKSKFEGEVPKGRYGHSMVSFGSYGHVIVFGGLGEGNIYLNDMWILDTRLTHCSWEYVKPKGDFWPKAREGHAACVPEGLGCMVLLGGFNGSYDVSQPGVIEVFDFETFSWSQKPTCGEYPPKGSNGDIFDLWNGCGKLAAISESNGGIFNQVHVLDVGVKPWCWSEVQLDWKGDWTMIPGQRSYFSSCYDPHQAVMYVFGGKSGTAGGEGMLHGTLVCVNAAEVAGIDLGEGEGEEEVVENNQGGIGEGQVDFGENNNRGTTLPGQDRYRKKNL